MDGQYRVWILSLSFSLVQGNLRSSGDLSVEPAPLTHCPLFPLEMGGSADELEGSGFTNRGKKWYDQ